MSEKKGDSRAKKTTINGNPLFDGTQGIETRFQEGVPKTDAEKEAISKGMRNANERRKVYAALLEKVSKKLGLRVDTDDISTKELITAFDSLIDAIGDRTNKQEIVGNLGLEKVFITPKEAKQTDKHIDDIINEQSEL